MLLLLMLGSERNSYLVVVDVAAVDAAAVCCCIAVAVAVVVDVDVFVIVVVVVDDVVYVAKGFRSSNSC